MSNQMIKCGESCFQHTTGTHLGKCEH